MTSELQTAAERKDRHLPATWCDGWGGTKSMSRVEWVGSFGGSLHGEAPRDLAIETAGDAETRIPYTI